ncbi:MAG: histidine--tRNA ligase [Candidatus Dormibacteraceae bacterium]
MPSEQLVAPKPISGFPEWLPEVRLVELEWLERIREIFESYGFCSIETPSAESLDVLMAKGEVSQEIYTLRRLQAEEDERHARLGLHFDLTVPFARYVAQHFNDLVFPFKRYQIQRVWRGERPQEGRYREFTQCDIDVINIDQVPIHFDAEMPRIIHEILTDLEIGDFSININNRKILQGFYQGLGIDDPLSVIQIADKLDKIGAEGVERTLTDRLGLSSEQVRACLDLAEIRGTDASVVDSIARLGPTSDILREGLEEFGIVMDSLKDLPKGSILADLSIARGLDYYTGTVYEGKLLAFPDYGSICSGGRYENLAGSFIRRNLPGIGMSIGLTRLFAKVIAEGIIHTGASCPSEVLVVIPSKPLHQSAASVAAQLRQRGLKVELYHQADKLAKQIRYASRKGIPFVWFPPFEEGKPHEVKNMTSGEQSIANIESWVRP